MVCLIRLHANIRLERSRKALDGSATAVDRRGDSQEIPATLVVGFTNAGAIVHVIFEVFRSRPARRVGPPFPSISVGLSPLTAKTMN